MGVAKSRTQLKQLIIHTYKQLLKLILWKGNPGVGWSGDGRKEEGLTGIQHLPWPSCPEIKLSPQDAITPSQPLQTPRFERSHGLSWAMQPGGRWDSKLLRSLIQQVMWILMWIHTGTAGAQRSVALLYCKCSDPLLGILSPLSA